MNTGLAYVAKVTEIHPIENADRIESAIVVCGSGGRWLGVVKKGDFSVGSPCVAILQDAVVPPNDKWRFLESSKWRVRMARFRGAPSECVIVPSEFPHPTGVDVTEALGITKYEKPIPVNMAGDPLGWFPSFIPKTDEPNFQSVPHLVDALRGKPFVATVKADGSSCTAYRRDGHFGVCSRNLELKDGDNVYWRVAKAMKLHEVLPERFAVQFEVVGPGVQGNPLGLKEPSGMAFNVWCMDECGYLSHERAVTFCADLSIPTVSVAIAGGAFDFTDDELRKVAEGTYSNGKQREGLVFRPVDDVRLNSDRLSFKVINLLYKD